jgi:hypothetical protein
VRIANHAAGPHQLGRSWPDGYLDGAAGQHVAKLQCRIEVGSRAML